MNDEIDEPSAADDAAALRARADELEQQLRELQRQSDARIIRAELRTEAVRAGIIDIDDLRLLDLSTATLTEHDEVEDATGIVARFKKAKPWLFNAGSSSSSHANVPPTQSPRPKLATEMNDAEYAAARAALLKQRY